MKDFDAAFAELDGDPILLRLYGQEWPVPRSVPALAMLKVIRLRQQRNAGDVAEIEVVVDAAKAFLGDADMVDAWLAKGISIENLHIILEHVASERRGGDAEGEADPAPETTPGNG